jgi:hypothetical protein
MADAALIPGWKVVILRRLLSAVLCSIALSKASITIRLDRFGPSEFIGESLNLNVD